MIAAIIAAVVAAVTSLITWFIKTVGKKAAIRILIGTVFFGIFAGVLGTVNGLLSALSYVAPTTWTQVQNFILPSNFSVCVATIMGVRSAAWFWSWKKFYFEMLAGGS